MSSISTTQQGSSDESWRQVQDIFEEYEQKDTEYVKEQLEFMGSTAVGYPDGTSMYWEEETPQKYEELVESFGEADEYVSHFEDGSVAVLVEQEDGALFAVYGEEKGGYRSNRFGFSNVIDSLSG